MKILAPSSLLIRRASVWGAFFILAVASPTAASAAPDPSGVVVTMPSEGESLAKGFEAGFREIPTGPIFLTYLQEGSALRTLSGVRSVNAKGAVLVVVTDRGTTLVIPATRVLVLTDERPSGG